MRCVEAGHRERRHRRVLDGSAVHFDSDGPGREQRVRIDPQKRRRWRRCAEEREYPAGRDGALPRDGGRDARHPRQDPRRGAAREAGARRAPLPAGRHFGLGARAPLE